MSDLWLGGFLAIAIYAVLEVMFGSLMLGRKFEIDTNYLIGLVLKALIFLSGAVLIYVEVIP